MSSLGLGWELITAPFCVRQFTKKGRFSVRIPTEGNLTAEQSPPRRETVEGWMDTLIDILMLLSAYAGLSLVCAALLRVLWTPSDRTTYGRVTSRG